MDLVLRLPLRLLEVVALDLLLLVVALFSPPLLLMEDLGLFPLRLLVLPLLLYLEQHQLFRSEIPSQQFHNPLVRHRLSQLRQLISGSLLMDSTQVLDNLQAVLEAVTVTATARGSAMLLLGSATLPLDSVTTRRPVALEMFQLDLLGRIILLLRLVLLLKIVPSALRLLLLAHSTTATPSIRLELLQIRHPFQL